MFEPKATASHLDSTVPVATVAHSGFGSIAPGTDALSLALTCIY
jgi:hypothetical protein